MKNFVLSAVCLGLVVLAEGCSSKAATQDPPHDTSAIAAGEIVGAWRTHAHFNDGALLDLKDLEFMYSFNAGGTLTQSSNYDGTPPVPPGYGVWRKIGLRRFELKYAFYSPPKFQKSGRVAAWIPTGRGIYTETLELSADGTSYHSHIVYTPVDPQDAPIDGRGEGDATGTRIAF